MKIKWRNELISLLFIAAAFILALISWNRVPNRIPVHWNITGQPDGYGGKFEGLLLMPLIAAGIYLMLIVLPAIDPRKENYQRMANTYSVIRMAIVVYMSVFSVVLTLVARGAALKIALIVPVMVGALFVILGNYFGKLRQTWFVGIRTPWTLSSTLSWNKTHALGGKIFIGFGIGLIIAALVGKGWLFIVVGLAGGLGILYTIYYSYLVWKSDPAKNDPLFPAASRRGA
jgi:uncharacterized membrane protein